MTYYLLYDSINDVYCKGKPTNGYMDGRTLRKSNQPPKLYTWGSARQLQSYYKNTYDIKLDIIFVNVIF